MEKESPDFFRLNDCLLSFFADLFHVAIGFFSHFEHNMSVISFLYTYRIEMGQQHKKHKDSHLNSL